MKTKQLVRNFTSKVFNQSKNLGFTLVEIMIVVAIIGLLAAIAIPNFVKARENAQLNSIYNNLRILEGAKDQWALEQKKGTGQIVTLNDLKDYIKGGEIKSVVGETYDSTSVGTNSIANLPSNIGLGTYPKGSTISSQ
jgi:prepilin-type N-terminal cleavage/methylation domain-containing protein